MATVEEWVVTPLYLGAGVFLKKLGRGQSAPQKIVEQGGEFPMDEWGAGWLH